MKRTFIILIVILLTVPIIRAQNTGINYQAVARNDQGEALAKTNIKVILAIISDKGTTIWEETHDVQTSSLGLFSVALGQDPEKITQQKVESLASVEWNTGTYTLSVKADPGSGVVDLGSNEISAVPLALYGKDEDADPENEIQDLQLNTGTLSITGKTNPTSIDLSGFVASEMAWQKEAGKVLLPTGNVGVGTDTPEGVMDIQGSLAGDEPIFQVKNDQGIPVFAVYNEGVRVYIPDDLVLSKGIKGGFAVGGYNSTKALASDEYFLQVAPTGTNINYFVDESTKGETKGIKGGFAVGGFNSAKSVQSSSMYLDPYTKPITYDGGTIILLPIFDGLSPKGNTYLGALAGQNHEGHFNTSIGYQSGFNMDAFFTTFPSSNNASYNTTLGAFSGYANISGDRNVYIGYQAGYKNTGYGNIYIGYQAGSYATSVNNKLIIDNEDTSTPLIEGDFNADKLTFNSIVGIGRDPIGAYGLYVDGGSSTSYSMIVYKGIYVSGQIYATGAITSNSDIRIKKDISTITNGLDIISQLRGVRYKYKDDFLKERNLSSNDQIGVIAQEVELVLPEVVSEDQEGTKGVDYSKLTAVLIEAVKEQQKILDDNKQKINEQEQSMKEMQKMIRLLNEKVEALESE